MNNKINIIVLLITLLVLNLHSENKKEYRIPVPINSAEAVAEVFWDPEISDFESWNVVNGEEYGLKIFQNWAAVDFSWLKKPKTGLALKMQKEVFIDCSGYDKLILSMNAPENSKVKFYAYTDIGKLSIESIALGREREFEINIKDAVKIDKLEIEVFTENDREEAGWLSWIILQNSERLKYHLNQWNNFDEKWAKYIKDDSFVPSFLPAYGIFINQDIIKKMREYHKELSEKHQATVFNTISSKAKKYTPEKAICEYANGEIHVFKKENFSSIGVSVAVVGLVLKDKELLRIAARHALSLAVSKYWDYGFPTQYPLSSWELRAFKRSYVAEDISWILDLAGEIFTPAGKHLLLRRLSEEGIGPINYTTWKHDNIFTSNQLAFFNTGRMAAYLVLEREFPRVAQYTDIAYNETIENLKKMLLPDGSSFEGPGYYGSLVRRNCNVLKYYAISRNYDFLKIIPEHIMKSTDFAAVIASTTDDEHIAICDSDGNSMGYDTLILLASLMPDSYWNYLAQKELKSTTMDNPFDIIAAKELQTKVKELPNFIFLPETGYIASHRKLEEYIVKIFIMGNKKDADHNHEDKGNFILEFAGDSFATDIGIGSYKDPMHLVYKQCQRHNMLVPIDMENRPLPENPLPYDVKPTGNGNKTKFSAMINATPGWDQYYKKWIRRWKSTSPEKLTIEDEYILKKGLGVEFYWQTLLPVKLEKENILIDGKKAQVIIDIPEGCEARIDKLPMQKKDQILNRIVFIKNAKSGKIKVEVLLKVK